MSTDRDAGDTHPNAGQDVIAVITDTSVETLRIIFGILLLAAPGVAAAAAYAFCRLLQKRKT